ncbi:unnamed protein product [Brassicogethes aeneus]|uniref:DUF4806 domain-containing protein n=1 Tax=Brassicogethes aeneus TaxID=1431903 RepID=A0A9P0FKV0_BRAAE|nr:unnamed protein product [Brassicogethes aeneus]
MSSKFKKNWDIGPRQMRRKIETLRKTLHSNRTVQDASIASTSRELHAIDLSQSNGRPVENAARSIGDGVSSELSESGSNFDHQEQSDLEVGPDPPSSEDGTDSRENETDSDENERDDVDNEGEEDPNENIEIVDVIPEAPPDLRYNCIRSLKNAFLTANMSHAQQKVILRTLRSEPFGLLHVPKDPRTIMATPSTVVRNLIQNVSGGKYVHFGFENLVIEKLRLLSPLKIPQLIYIDFSTDGGQVFKSGSLQFWPIQFRLFNVFPKRPLFAGVFVSDTKPSDPFEFFDQFVAEITTVTENGGINFQNRLIPVHIRCFIADAPARAFALNHFGHMSCDACSKCSVEGNGHLGPTVFLGVEHNPRTDENYRNLVYDGHQKGSSPLSAIMGLVTQVPFECMHLIYLGVTKKILSAILEGKYAHTRLNARKINILNARMQIIRDYCSSDFGRRPAPLSKYSRFKATEFRQFLLYTACAVLQNVISDECYRHFMLLSCVTRLLSFVEIEEEHFVFCENALKSFVQMAKILYGEQFLSYNIHGLLHVVEDVRKFGRIESYSAFCFENNMREITKNIRKPEKVLEQYYKRVKEPMEEMNRKKLKRMMPSTSRGRVPLKNPKYIDSSESDSRSICPSKKGLLEEWSTLRILAETKKSSNKNILQKKAINEKKEKAILEFDFDSNKYIPETEETDQENDVLQKVWELLQDSNERIRNIEKRVTNNENCLREINEKMLALEEKIDHSKPSQLVTVAVEGFPLKTIEEFEEMEKPENDSKRSEMASRLAVIGAEKLRNFAYLMVEECMADELVEKFSWCGNRGNKMLFKTQLCAMFLDAAQECNRFSGPANYAELKLHIDEVFRSIKQRIKKTKEEEIIIEVRDQTVEDEVEYEVEDEVEDELEDEVEDEVESCNNEGSYVLNFLRKYKSGFRFPDLQDISTVSREDIVSKIPKQHQMQHQELQG